MRDFMYVADTKDLWREYAISNGIAHAEDTPEGLLLVYNPGFTADHIGAVISVPGVYDNSVFPPIEITPPVWDNRFHVNLRVIGDEIEDKFIRLKTYKPQAITGVSWLEPELVTTPVRVWLGEMIYFSENIPDLLPINTSPPVLSHLTAAIGNVVSIMTPGTWTGEPDLITYQWMRSGAPINQAITMHHTVNVLDNNHILTCEETARNSAGTASALSNECVVGTPALEAAKAPVAAPKRPAAKKTAKQARRNRAEIARKPANTRTKAMVAKKKQKKPVLFTKEAASKAVKKIAPQRKKKK